MASTPKVSVIRGFRGFNVSLRTPNVPLLTDPKDFWRNPTTGQFESRKRADEVFAVLFDEKLDPNIRDFKQAFHWMFDLPESVNIALDELIKYVFNLETPNIQQGFIAYQPVGAHLQWIAVKIAPLSDVNVNPFENPAVHISDVECGVVPDVTLNPGEATWELA